MSAYDNISLVVEGKTLLNYDLKWCLVDKNKLPFQVNGSVAKPNQNEDFVDFIDIVTTPEKELKKYAGIGISVKASNLYAIDVDDCFSTPFVLDSADDRALDILLMFATKAYIEFSFSGKGMRILFYLNEPIKDYDLHYYTKNSHNHIEFYRPEGNARYVTITGKYIMNDELTLISDNQTILSFLEKYMTKPKIVSKIVSNDKEDLSLNQLLIQVKKCYFKNIDFQNMWFDKAPGSGSDESEKDFSLLKFIVEHFTTDKEKARLLFEESDYFKSKDKKHIYKWEYGNHRYFDYMFKHIVGG